MNYQVIRDANLLRQFIDWLPELKETEKYYICLFARSKYCKDISHIKSDKAQLKRFVSDKERMFDKIWQTECPVGAYKQYKMGKQETIDIPQEALALYISLNPRDLWKASFNSSVKLITAIRDTNTLMNPHAEVMSEIQKSKGETRYAHFDIDESDEIKLAESISKIPQFINRDAVTLLRTRGGVHILLDVKKIVYPYKNKWYTGLSSLAGVDQSGDMMIPVPGCTQGMFIPHFVNLEDYEKIAKSSVTTQSE